MSTPVEPPKYELVPTNPAPKPKPLLCRQCKSIRFRRLHPPTSAGDVFPLHPTRDSLLESLRLGCRLCVLISSFLDLDEPDQPSSSEPERDAARAFLDLQITWQRSYEFLTIDSSTVLPPFESLIASPFKAHTFDIVNSISVSCKAKTIMPRSTRLEVHQRHVSGSCFPTVHRGHH